MAEENSILDDIYVAVNDISDGKLVVRAGSDSDSESDEQELITRNKDSDEESGSQPDEESFEADNKKPSKWGYILCRANGQCFLFYSILLAAIAFFVLFLVFVPK